LKEGPTVMGCDVIGSYRFKKYKLGKSTQQELCR